MPDSLTLNVVLRAIALGGLTCLVILLLSSTHLYATVIVLAVIAVVLIADLSRVIARADRTVERFLESLTANTVEVPAAGSALDARLIEPFALAAAKLNSARAAHQQQLEYFQALLDTVAAALFVVRPDGRVQLINRAARALAAQSVERIQDIAGVGETAAKTLAVLPPGTRRIMALADGVQVHVVVSQFSVPGRGAERLISLQRIAGELDAVELKAWQDMSRVLAHEMMNSLTPIASLAESLEVLLRDSAHRNDSTTSDEVANALEAIQRRSLGLIDFVDRYRQVLELPQPNLQPVHMERFLSGIGNLMSATFAAKAIDYRCRVVPENLVLSADPQLLEQAIINLLRNANDAVADVAHPQVELSCELQDTEIIIAVCDNGRGLTETEKERIFVPFFTTKPGGSGIGLNLARHVALAHGGRLDMRAHHPQGAAFSIRLLAVAGAGEG